MCDEEDFERHLDARPDDHDARRVYADWLDERGDARAAGYRAMGEARLRPHPYPPLGPPLGWRWESGTLPGGWADRVPAEYRSGDAHPVFSRRRAEDAAALAYRESP